MSSSKAIAEAKKNTATETQAKIVEKQTAQVEAAQQTATAVDEKAELKEKIASGTLTERVQARREYIRKYLI
jgi:anti-sigma28 factor (negative regulator of flagellin synthesis)